MWCQRYWRTNSARSVNFFAPLKQSLKPLSLTLRLYIKYWQLPRVRITTRKLLNIRLLLNHKYLVESGLGSCFELDASTFKMDKLWSNMRQNPDLLIFVVHALATGQAWHRMAIQPPPLEILARNRCFYLPSSQPFENWTIQNPDIFVWISNQISYSFWYHNHLQTNLSLTIQNLDRSEFQIPIV